MPYLQLADSEYDARVLMLYTTNFSIVLRDTLKTVL